MNRRTVSIALLAPSASLAASAAAAQQFPTRPLRLIVGFPPGMGPDSIAPSSYARLPYDPQKHFAPGGLVSGSVQATFVTVGLAAPQAKGGKLRALATTGKERSTALPDTPTLAEASYPKLDFTAWFGFVAPCKTPPDVLDTLNTAVVKATGFQATPN